MSFDFYGHLETPVGRNVCAWHNEHMDSLNDHDKIRVTIEPFYQTQCYNGQVSFVMYATF